MRPFLPKPIVQHQEPLSLPSPHPSIRFAKLYNLSPQLSYHPVLEGVYNALNTETTELLFRVLCVEGKRNLSFREDPALREYGTTRQITSGGRYFMDIAIQEYLDGKAADWMEQVSDEQYQVG